jgi:hypothetical protein
MSTARGFALANIAKALGQLGDPAAVDPLKPLLGDPHGYIREIAANSLEQLGAGADVATGKDAAVRALLAQLDGPNPRQAALQLGEMQIHEATPALISLLDRNNEIAGAAARALGHLRASAAVDPIIRCLGAPFVTVRCEAALSLGAIGDARAVPALMRNLSDGDWGVRNTAAIALGLIGDPRAVRALQSATRDRDATVANSARKALEAIGSVPAEAPASAPAVTRRSPARAPVTRRDRPGVPRAIVALSFLAIALVLIVGIGVFAAKSLRTRSNAEHLAGQIASTWIARLDVGGASVRVTAVTSDFFIKADVNPEIGRMFATSDFETRMAAAVISDRLWHSQFGGRMDILGSELALDGSHPVIIGVAPPRFTLPEETDVWVPAAK